jgi:hypothetical protein
LTAAWNHTHLLNMSNTSHVHLHMRLPTGLLAAVDALAKKDLLTRTGWITRALISCCEVAQEPSRIAALEARCAANLKAASSIVEASR